MPTLKRQSELLTLFLFTVDAGCICLSALLAAGLHPEVGMAQAVPLFREFLPYFGFVCATWLLVGWTQGMFISHRRDTLALHLLFVVRAVSITLIVDYFIISVISGQQVDPRFTLYFGVFFLVSVGVFRTLLTIALWFLRQRGLNARHIVICGANHRAALLVRALLAQSQYGYKVIGVLDDDPERMRYLDGLDVPYLGKFDDAERILNTYVVDEFHVCLPIRSRYETIQVLADLCLGVGVSMRMIADLFPIQLANSRLHSVEGVPMLSLSMVSENYAQLTLKRIIDLVGSLVGLILLAPLMIIVAILIKLTSPGPVFFAQERVGLNQRKFRMLKFRSMVADAEVRKKDLESMNEVDGPIFKIRNDPRVTPVGRFIRRYSIDELPQLINVFKGEMSLVGPRPHPTKEVAQYTWHQRRRLSVKPGMTGLAQVSGRSDLSWQECVELDLGYIDSWSPLRDIWIMFRTVRTVLLAHGAS